MQEEAHQVFGNWRGHQADKNPRLNFHCGVEVDTQGVGNHVQNLNGRWHQAPRFLEQHGVGTLQHLGDLGVLGVATRNFKALHIPGVHRLWVGFDPRLGFADHAWHIVSQLFNQTGFQCFLGIKAGAFQQRHNGAFNAKFIHHAHNTATARQQTQAHFRQTHLHGLAVECNAVVTGQANLVTAAERRTVNGRNHWATQFLHAAQHTFDLEVHLKHFCLALTGLQAEHAFDIAAGKETAFCRCEHHTGNGFTLRFQAVNGLAHQRYIFVVHRIDRTAHVHSHRYDVVAIFFVVECSSHRTYLFC